MNDLNILNIPAYQRKRSLSAKARKKPFATIKPISQIPKSKVQPVKRFVKKVSKLTFEDALTDIPIRTSLPSQELFPVEITKKQDSDFREMQICGQCEGYFDKIDVAIIKLTSPLRAGDTIIFEQEGGLFEQKANSIQIDRKNVALAKTGSDIGLKVIRKPKIGTPVYKII